MGGSPEVRFEFFVLLDVPRHAFAIVVALVM
jgi:hypothetical protein